MARRDDWMLYAVVGAVAYLVLRHRAATTTPAAAASPVVTSSGTGQPLQLVPGNPNNLVSVATPEEEASMMGGGGSTF